MGISASIFENTLNRVSKKQFIIQSAIFAKNIRKLMEDKLKDVNSSENLELLFNTPFSVVDEANGVSIELSFSSGNSRVNINNILINNKENKIFLEALDNLLLRYNVEDRVFFESIVLDTLDKDEEERMFDSEIISKNRFFKNGHIDNFKQWNKIIDYYKQKREDLSIEKIPWKQIISFNGKEIDYNNITADTLLFILKNETRDSILSKKEEQEGKVYNSFNELDFDKNDKDILKSFGIIFFGPIVVCNATVKLGNQNGNFSFYYNLKTKKASNFELNF